MFPLHIFYISYYVINVYVMTIYLKYLHRQFYIILKVNNIYQ